MDVPLADAHSRAHFGSGPNCCMHRDGDDSVVDEFRRFNLMLVEDVSNALTTTTHPEIVEVASF